MGRSKKLVSLLVVLLVVLAATIFVLTYEEKKEEIKNSGEIILAIEKDDVTGISWRTSTNSLAFYKESQWMYEGDEEFPVDGEKLIQMVDVFEALEASFAIENVEDFGQYGLENPEYTITLETEEKTYDIWLGDFSSMDEERYISIGDGNVYLVADDPAVDFDLALSDLILHDSIPDMEDATKISFTGIENYIIYQEENSITYDKEDLFYTEGNRKKQAMDTEKVEGYLNTIGNLSLTDYVTYNATEKELVNYGLKEPELVISVTYQKEDEDGKKAKETFDISVGRNQKEVETAKEDESVPAYVRIGDSNIIYEITDAEYESLLASSYEDFCHQQLFWADFSLVTELEFHLEGETYKITAEGKEDDRLYKLEEQEIEIEDIRSAISGLTIKKYTDMEVEGKEEIKVTIRLEHENVSEVEIGLYRYDGTTCAAVVDGELAAFVEREQVVALIEAVNAVVLG